MQKKPHSFRTNPFHSLLFFIGPVFLKNCYVLSWTKLTQDLFAVLIMTLSKVLRFQAA